MKAISVEQFGGPDVLELSEVPDPRPAPGEVLISIEASGVGYVDVMAREGHYHAFTEAGFVPGLEIAGVVSELGDGVDAGWLGRRVFAMPMTGGGYAEYVAVSSDQLIPLPDGVSARSAVALGMNALVAKITVERMGSAPGESVYVRGAGGGIGIMAVQICNARGAHVTATTSSALRGERLRALGAEHVVDRHASGESDSRSYDLIVDTVAGPQLGSYVAKLKPNGRYILCGGVGGAPAEDFGRVLLENFHRSPTFSAFSLNSVENPAIVTAGTELFAGADRGAITPVVHCELPLADAASAHAELEAGRVFGKVVLIP
ncbi:zinc-dependent alcohol dehydrogenase family protein [Mycolicibacterium smegmatis]|uniref:zinc-dependent alcohol dehydrogenase family protein n=1 Tax=Mycolicibacterium smegmatis TaxID=1772 RepID=UPI001E452B55|nr:zinc-dependent alcohol dehydrogenase family protein [Mycolicibacterium smegmatis]UGU32543.1 zinc-dependent alcohol dehydrogenase family protein [Mycolicibacterium smegmatis]ULN67436.1 zinc-dependent alcohol dehydrogenase family protein [Mycolicibacterium smegmatis]